MKRWRRWVAKSWLLSWCHYRLYGTPLVGHARDLVWYFAYGANMHDSAFRDRRGMQPREWRVGRLRGYQLRFNLDGRPKGKAAPANLAVNPQAEVWGVLYCITRQDLLLLNASEGVPGRRYRQLWIDAQDTNANIVHAVTYVADGNEVDGNPSLRYITLLREGAQAHGLPEHYLKFLDEIPHAQ
jgi:gamma-glutamylcyclotransferase